MIDKLDENFDMFRLVCSDYKDGEKVYVNTDYTYESLQEAEEAFDPIMGFSAILDESTGEIYTFES